MIIPVIISLAMNRNFQRFCHSTALLFICLCIGLNQSLPAMPADTNSSTQFSVQESSTNIPIKRAAADRKITDFDYTNLTEAQVIAVWGPPDAYTDYAGTNNFFSVYRVGDNEQWMAFKAEPPHHLIDYMWMPPAAKVVFEKRTRKLSDLTITNGITYEHVTAVWGRPDYFPPTGIEYYSFLFEHNEEVWIQFDFMHPPYRALGASLINRQNGKITHFF